MGPAARDTDSQAVCSLVGKTATVGLDHSTSQDGRWKQIGTPCGLNNALQWLLRLCCNSSWLDRVGKKQTWPSIATMMLLCLDST